TRRSPLGAYHGGAADGRCRRDFPLPGRQWSCGMGTVNALGDQKRTIAYANRALERIRHLGQPGDPRSYAAWFAYATNRNPSQNIVVDQTIARRGGISPADVEKLYGYAPADASTGKVDDLAASVAGEVEQVVTLIDAAAGKVAAWRNSISHVA